MTLALLIAQIVATLLPAIIKLLESLDENQKKEVLAGAEKIRSMLSQVPKS